MMVGKILVASRCCAMEGQPMNPFTITILAAGVFLLIGVIAMVRGKPLAGLLAIVLAVGIGGFGYRQEILQNDDDPTPVVTAEATLPATPVP
jgi:hypothetical protein